MIKIAYSDVTVTVEFSSACRMQRQNPKCTQGSNWITHRKDIVDVYEHVGRIMLKWNMFNYDVILNHHMTERMSYCLMYLLYDQDLLEQCGPLNTQYSSLLPEHQLDF